MQHLGKIKCQTLNSDRFYIGNSQKTTTWKYLNFINQWAVHLVPYMVIFIYYVYSFLQATWCGWGMWREYLEQNYVGLIYALWYTDCMLKYLTWKMRKITCEMFGITIRFQWNNHWQHSLNITGCFINSFMYYFYLTISFLMWQLFPRSSP